MQVHFKVIKYCLWSEKIPKRSFFGNNLLEMIVLAFSVDCDLYSCTHLTSAANFCTYPERNLLDCLGRVSYPREGVMHLE